jgi:hypothetical protein
MEQYQGKNWNAVVALLPNRTKAVCQKRWNQTLRPSKNKSKTTTTTNNRRLQHHSYNNNTTNDATATTRTDGPPTKRLLGSSGGILYKGRTFGRHCHT